MWLHSKSKKQIQCVVLFLCHFWPWAFIHNIPLLCPHGLMLLQRNRQGVRRPEFSFKFSHNLFRHQRCQQWHLLSPYFTISSEQKQSRQQSITHRHLSQASRLAAQRRKNIWGTVSMFLWGTLLKYLKHKVNNGLCTFKRWCISCAMLFKLSPKEVLF